MKTEYRAWDKKEEVMIYNIEEHWDCHQCNLEYGGGRTDFEYPMSFGDFLNNDRFIVMQYTGRIDKYGDKLYVGDIVYGIANWCVAKEIISEVVWSPQRYGFRLSPIDSRYGLYSLTGLEDSRVIGNIYENPELLQ